MMWVTLVGILLWTSESNGHSMVKRQYGGYGGYGVKGGIKNGGYKTECDNYPDAPKKGKIECQSLYGQQTCDAECYEGFHFPDKTTHKQISCTNGQFKPYSSFPDCEPMYTCDQPDIPKYGKMVCKTSPSNDKTCTAECTGGFHFPDGSYSKEIYCIKGVFQSPGYFPDCIRACLDLPIAPKYGKITCKKSYGEQICTAECVDDFHFHDKTRQKQVSCVNGVFEPYSNFPDCEPMYTCDQPDIPKNGKMVCKTSPSNDKKCVAECVSGSHFPDGTYTKEISCVKGVYQSPGHFPDCIRACKNFPAAPKYGKIACTKSFGLESCAAECNDGFHFHDKTTQKQVSCDNGEFKPFSSFPDCEPMYKCDQPDIPKNGKMDCKTSPSNDKKCVAECVSGSHFPDGTYTKEISCIKGVFQSPGYFPDCIRACKDFPAAPKYGKIACTKSLGKESCAAECTDGFHFHDKTTQKQVSCVNGEFKPFSSFPDCEPMYKCDQPDSPKNGKMFCKTSPSNDKSCTAECAEGFHFPDGTYTKEINCIKGVFLPFGYFPDCIPAFTCDDIATPMYGKMSCKTLPSNDKICTGECYKGYQFPDKSIYKDVYCRKGVFSSTFPDCIPIYSQPQKGGKYEKLPAVKTPSCEAPTSVPLNTKVNCRGTKTQLTCQVNCLDGYQFPDKSYTKEIKCSNGYFTPSSKLPDCEPACKLPCQYGGICVGKNTCSCKEGYFGRQCQKPTSICDLKATHNVGYHCNIEHDVMTCVLSCPDTMTFEFTPEESYECDLSGNWYPRKIPNCVRKGFIKNKY